MLLSDTKEEKGHVIISRQMEELHNQHMLVLKQVAMQPENHPRPTSLPPVASQLLPSLSK